MYVPEFQCMHLPRYSYKINESFTDYEFISKGPKGSIKKVVRFTNIEANIYNLAFGDLIERNAEMNDRVATNNNDSLKVLSTVAVIVKVFTKRYENVVVFAKGSTHARTRLYRMGITNNWQAISADFEVFGLLNGEWLAFELRLDFEAFLIYRKKN